MAARATTVVGRRHRRPAGTAEPRSTHVRHLTGDHRRHRPRGTHRRAARRRPHGRPAQDVRARRQRRARPRRRGRRLRRRPVHRRHGPVGLRQVDPDARHRRARHRDQRHRLDRRHRPDHPQGQGADPAPPGPGRLRLPAVQPGADADRRREHRAADAPRRPHARPGLAGPRSSTSSGSATGCGTGRASSPAASSSGSPWPGPWSARPEVVFADEPTGNLDSRSGARGAVVPAPLGRRERPDHRHGHPRPGRRQPRRPRRLPRRRPGRRRHDRARPPSACSTT